MADARVTQAAVETLASAVPGVRVTQRVVELLGGTTALPQAVKVTQAPVELLGTMTVGVQVTQAIIEALGGSDPLPVDVVVTQYVVEALGGSDPIKDYTWQIKDLTDATRWMTGLLVFPVGETPAPTPTVSAGRVIIPMHVTTRVVFPVGLETWGGECLCDE